MRLIGITGSIACGKSTVSRELIRRGFPVIDGDALSRELTGPDGQAMNRIRAVFGEQYILPDGSLNRAEMGRLVFSDDAARELLDQVMAPYLQALTLNRIEAARSSGSSLCFLDMPLLYEKGYDRYCDTVWCVWIPEELQISRLMNRDGFSRQEALSRINAVMSSDEKANLSAVVIDNSGSVSDTLSQVSALLDTEISRAGSHPRRKRVSAGPLPADPSPAQAAQPSRPALSVTPDIGFDRPEALRKSHSRRRASWIMPRWIKYALVVLTFFLIVSFTTQMLMNAYLSQRQQEHTDEQKAIDEQYPLMYTDLILSISGEYNISPALVAAVIRNESSFRPGAESSVGARGLMQLMPDTAEWIAHKLQLDDNYQFDRMYDPGTNIRFGCWYLNYLSSLFNGNPLCVICAYHAGQGEISSWLSNPLYSSDGITLDLNRLPDGPTKQYAGRVTRDYGIYQAKYFRNDLTDPSGAASVSQ